MEENNQKTDILTIREFEVLKLLSKGYTTMEISSMLHLAPGEVQNHRKKLCKKFKVRNGPELIYRAVKGNLI